MDSPTPRVASVMLLLPLVAGCSVPAPRSALSDPQANLVDVQVCVPDRRAEATEVVVDASAVPPDLSSQEWEDMRLLAEVTGKLPESTAANREPVLVTMRRVQPAEGPGATEPSISMGAVSVSQGVGSDSSGGAPLKDVTVSGQPVYAKPIFREPGEVRALHVLRRSGTDGAPVQFWFAPLHSIPREDYTPWMQPTYQAPLFAPGNPRTGLFGGRGLPAGPVDARAPRVRYKVVARRDYWGGSPAAGTRAGRAQALGMLTRTNPVVAGPRPAPLTIPGC